MAREDPTLETLWKNALERWDDDRAHALLMEHGQKYEALGEVAARYAAMRGDRDRGAAVEKKLEAVALLAQMALTATQQTRKPGRSRWFTIAALLLFGTLVAYVAYRLARI